MRSPSGGVDVLVRSEVAGIAPTGLADPSAIRGSDSANSERPERADLPMTVSVSRGWKTVAKREAADRYVSVTSASRKQTSHTGAAERDRTHRDAIRNATHCPDLRLRKRPVLSRALSLHKGIKDQRVPGSRIGFWSRKAGAFPMRVDRLGAAVAIVDRNSQLLRHQSGIVALIDWIVAEHGESAEIRKRVAFPAEAPGPWPRGPWSQARRS